MTPQQVRSQIFSIILYAIEDTHAPGSPAFALAARAATDATDQILGMKLLISDGRAHSIIETNLRDITDEGSAWDVYTTPELNDEDEEEL